MGFSEIAVIALGLSMDAFAVAITLGLSVKKPKPFEFLLPGLYFGFFQAMMPLAGYFAGMYFAQKIQQADHWIAFALLGFCGGKMIKDGFSGDPEKTEERPLRFTNMLLLAAATSIDALAVGITFAFFNVNIFTAVLITGLTTFCISAAGVKAGIVFGTKLKSKAECAGGAVLVLLGCKILIDHLFF
jgi:putative Mn2+ efflux pump MntP